MSENKKSSFSWDTIDSVEDSSPGSLSNQQGLMENVQLFNKLSDNVIQQNGSTEINKINNLKTHNTSGVELDVFKSDQNLMNMPSNFQGTSTNLKMFGNNEIHLSLKKQENTVASNSFETLDSLDLNKTQNLSEDKSVSKVFGNHNRSIVIKDSDDADKSGKIENHSLKLVDTFENEFLPANYKEDKKRKFDELFEKKFGIESKKAKLPNEITGSQKATVANGLKKNNCSSNKEIAAVKKDDIYSFEDEIDLNESAEFSYQSFDKNVLHKRKTSAKFSNSKKSKKELEKRNHLSSSKDLDKPWSEVNGDKNSSQTLQKEPAVSNIVPLTSEIFGADFTFKGGVRDNDKNLAETNVKDNTISDNGKAELPEHRINSGINFTIKQKKKYFRGIDKSSATGMSQNIANNFADHCDLFGNFSCDTGKISQNSVYNGVLPKISPEKVCSDGSKRISRKTVPSCDKGTCLTDVIHNGSSKKVNEEVIPTDSRDDVCKNVVYNGISKAERDNAVYKNGSRNLSLDTVYRSPKVSNRIQSNGVYETMFDRGQKTEKYLGIKCLKSPFNGNKVIDKRLEAIRKVSLWIGDCMDCAAGSMDSPEDLSMDKIAREQKNGIRASLSVTSTTSSVKTKCADSDVKCAMSKALLKSKCAENLKVKRELENDKSEYPQNRKPKRETENVITKYPQNVKETSSFARNGGLSIVNNMHSDVSKSKKQKGAVQKKISVASEEQAKNRSELITFGNWNEKPSEPPAFGGVKNVEQATGVLDLKFQEQDSTKFDQSWFDSKSKLLDSRLSFAPDAGFLNKSLSPNGKIAGGYMEQRHSKLKARFEEDLKNYETKLIKNGTKTGVKGNKLDLRADLSKRGHGTNIEQIEGFESDCVDLSIKNFDVESRNKLSDKNIVSRNTVETHYGAEVWGLGNDVYSIDADVINVNDVKQVKNVTHVDENASLIYGMINVKDVDVSSGEYVKTDKENIANRNSAYNDVGISEILQTQTSIMGSASSRNGNLVDIRSNKIGDIVVDTGRGNNGKTDYTVNTVNYSDTSSFSFTPEDFNLTYPNVVVNMKEETQNEPLDLHLNFENVENVKDFSVGSVPDVRSDANKHGVLLKRNVELSLPEFSGAQSEAMLTELNKEMPNNGESQNLNIGEYAKNKSDTKVGVETSPQIPDSNPGLTNGLPDHDWSTDDLASLDLDNLDEDHSLENINPVSIVDCPVSISGSLVSVNGKPVSLSFKPVSASSNPASGSSIAFSAESDSFSNYPVSMNGTPVSSDGSNTVSSISDNKGNQFPNIIDNNGNQFPAITDNAGNQISNIVDNTGNQFSDVSDNAGNQFPLDDELIGENEDYQWNETLKSFIMQNLENEPKEENGVKEPAADVKLLLEQKLAEQYLNRNIESLKRKHSVDL